MDYQFQNHADMPDFNACFPGYSEAKAAPFICDRVNAHGNELRPAKVIQYVLPRSRMIPAPSRLVKHNHRYSVIDRKGCDINIGILHIEECLIVNPKPDFSFDTLLCTMELTDDNHSIQRAFAYRDVARRCVTAYLWELTRCIDCKDHYVDAAFFQELRENAHCKFLQLPKKSGWNDAGTKRMFVSSETVIPQLEGYYPKDVLARKLLPTAECLENAADNLAKLLPKNWQYKLLLAIRITSLLLYFYADAGLKPDQLFVVEPRGEVNAKTVIAILKNKNPDSTAICELTECKTTLQRELQQMNDGLALFRDASYVEEKRKRDASLNVLLQDLNGGAENASRHITSIISDTPGTISSEYPAYFLTLEQPAWVDDIQGLQAAASKFDYALIQNLTGSDKKDNLVTWALQQPNCFSPTQINEDYQQTERMLRATMEIMKRNRLLSESEENEILRYLRNTRYEGCTSTQTIVNEFWRVLSHFLMHDKLLTITNQYGEPYFDKDQPMVFLDEECVNTQTKLLEKQILFSMKTTKKRGRLLKALQDCGQLCATNGNKRLLQVEVKPGVMESMYFFSFPRIYLTQRCQHKLRLLAQADFLFRKQEYPEGFLPIVSVDEKHCAGRVVDEYTDEAEGIYVSGQTRSGKTHFLVQQAVIRAASGQQVIIFDQTGAFAPDELRKHMPESIISKYFSFWDLRRNGLPVNLLSLEHCEKLPDKKDRLLSIFAAAARISGDVQEKTLRGRLSVIARAIESDQVSTLPETLRFFDEENPAQADLRDRLEAVFDDLDGVPMLGLNWCEFLRVQKLITVVSMGTDGIRKSNEITDMLLASLYAHKQYERTSRITAVLDEIDDLFLDKDGPLSKILRKGGKHMLSLMLASQKYSVENDRLGQLIGNCGLKIFFRPEDGDISDIAKHIACDRSLLAKLEQGDCVAYGGFYSRSRGKNRHQLIAGRTYLAEQFLPEKGNPAAEQLPE